MLHWVIRATFMLAALPLLCHPDAKASHPNVLILLADDQRRDTLGAYGNAQIDTPNLDLLARSGTNFRNNYCLGSIHGAVRQPSRAMLLSGRTLYRVSMELEGVVTLPEHFAKHGYQTFMTGKWHNGQRSAERAFPNSRSVFFGGMSDHTRVPICDIVQGKICEPRVGDKFSSELFADAAIEFLKSADSSQPFLAYVAFTAPHDPRQPPERYREWYYQRQLPLPPNFLPQHPFANGWMTGRDEQLASWPRKEHDIRDQLAEYYGAITHLDEQVGRILTCLREQGTLDKTVIIYAADHGLALGSHGLLGKQNLYEHSTGCPLMIRGPGIPRDMHSQALTYLLDIYPTLCDVVGIPRVAGLEGCSLQPLWTGQQREVRETLFTAYEGSMRAVRDSRWKLIRYPAIHHTQLFDLENDPYEMHNLAAQPDQQNRVAQMMRWIGDWQIRVGDPQPLTASQLQSMDIDLSHHPRRPDEWQPEWIRKKYFP